MPGHRRIPSIDPPWFRISTVRRLRASSPTRAQKATLLPIRANARPVLATAPPVRKVAGPTPRAFLGVGPATLRTGGAVANTGLALARIGSSVAFCARVGDDALSRLTVEILNQGGSIDGIRRCPGIAGSYT